MSMKFGIVVVPRSGAEWVRAVQGAEKQGYQTILLPDTVHTPSPFPALAAAAAVTSTVQLRPNVLAAPLRTPAATVREVAALQLISDGRFELGIGVGRPGAEAEAEKLGATWGSAKERRALLIETIFAVRAEVNPAPEVVIAASGPQMLAAAAGVADRILLAAMPQATPDDLGEMVRIARDSTDRDLHFTLQLSGVGDQLPYFLRESLGLTAADLRTMDAAGIVAADPIAAAESINYGGDKYGIDELLIPGELAQAFAPILAHYVDSHG